MVGFDGRHTSPLYAENVVKGLMECGINVVNIGLVPTPVVYFSLHHLNKDAGIIITASHNPAEYNGFKMLTNEEPIWGENIQQLGIYAKNGDFENGSNAKYEEINIKEAYFDFIVNKLQNGKKELKIVWDAGNGAVASILKDVVKRLPGQHITICDTVDGDFPNHHPDPAVEKNMEMLLLVPQMRYLVTAQRMEVNKEDTLIMNFFHAEKKELKPAFRTFCQFADYITQDLTVEKTKWKTGAINHLTGYLYWYKNNGNIVKIVSGDIF